MESTTIRVSKETMELMEAWRMRVENHTGVRGMSWDQLLNLFANSKVMP